MWIISSSENFTILFQLSSEAVFLPIGYPMMLLVGSLYSSIRLQRLANLSIRRIDRISVAILIMSEPIKESIYLSSCLRNVVLIYLIISLLNLLLSSSSCISYQTSLTLGCLSVIVLPGYIRCGSRTSFDVVLLLV